MIFPPGTPFMVDPEPYLYCVNSDAPDVCPTCGEETLYRFRNFVLHDGGVVRCNPTSACGNHDCTDDD